MDDATEDAPIECLVPSGCPWPIVLGIDPGTRVLGYGAIVGAPKGPRLLAAGVLRAGASDSVPKRLARMRAGLDEVLVRTAPTVVVVEGAFFHLNSRTALRLGEARGVALSCAARTGVDVVEISPAAAKKAVLGDGGGTKERVALMVARLLGVSPFEGELDMTDALALALAHLRRMEIDREIASAQRASR